MSEMISNKHEHWDMVIQPKTHFLNLNLKEVWRYRDLLWMFVRRDFVAQFKQTILGPVWHLIQPLFTTLIFLLIFGRIANMPTDDIKPSILFYMSGITIWNYFASCLTSTSNTFTANASIFGKVYFPRMVIPLSIVISNIIRFAIQFFLLLAFMIFYVFKGYDIHITIYWLLIPVLIVLMAGIGLGLGITISSFSTKYRDFAVLLTFAVQLGMYATPVVYPSSYLQSTAYKWIIDINPLAPIIESFRFALFGKGTFSITGLGYSTLFMIAILFVGAIVFNKVEKSFMDTV